MYELIIIVNHKFGHNKFNNYILYTNKKPISFIDFKVDIEFTIIKTNIKII